MKNLIAATGLLMVSFLTSGSIYPRLLTQDDLDFQEFNNAQGFAISSEIESEWPWGSYNRWQCFDVGMLSYDCAEYDYGILVPSLRFEAGQEVFYFDLHVEDRLDCHRTLDQWQSLISGGNEVCIFAAQMPDVDMGLDGNRQQSLWYINRLKGVGGYWNLFEESDELRE